MPSSEYEGGCFLPQHTADMPIQPSTLPRMTGYCNAPPRAIYHQIVQDLMPV